MDRNSVLKRRKELESKITKNKDIFRPGKDSSRIRVVPYKKDLDYNIVEL